MCMYVSVGHGPRGRGRKVGYVRGNAVSLLLSMVGRKEGGDTLNRVLYSMLCRRACVCVSLLKGKERENDRNDRIASNPMSLRPG